jgi:hypothetical protein
MCQINANASWKSYYLKLKTFGKIQARIDWRAQVQT